MIIHPPMLYLGFTGMVIPFAFAMAALASGDLSTNWIKATRRWALIAWLFLSLGLLLGGRWAYDVLGWGGYWGWDPVENAAFIPWLVGTAFLHSVMIQEKRGMLKVWNMFLVIFTFSAVIFGTFATRSGLIDSVHSFAQSGIGMPMFLFWGGMTLDLGRPDPVALEPGQAAQRTRFRRHPQPRVAVRAQQRRLRRAGAGDLLGQLRRADPVRTVHAARRSRSAKITSSR